MVTDGPPEHYSRITAHVGQFFVLTTLSLETISIIIWRWPCLAPIARAAKTIPSGECFEVNRSCLGCLEHGIHFRANAGQILLRSLVGSLLMSRLKRKGEGGVQKVWVSKACFVANYSQSACLVSRRPE
jgi:hypothetical protein